MKALIMPCIANNNNTQPNPKVLPARLWLRLYMAVASLFHAGLFIKTGHRTQDTGHRELTTNDQRRVTIDKSRATSHERRVTVLRASLPEDVSGLSIIRILSILTLKVKKNLAENRKQKTEYRIQFKPVSCVLCPVF